MKLAMASIFLILAKLFGIVGSILATILLWSDHRWLAIAAAGTLIPQVFLLKAAPLVATLGAAGGAGLFVFALTGNTWLSLVFAALEIALAFIVGEILENAMRRFHAEIIPSDALSPERLRRLQAQDAAAGADPLVLTLDDLVKTYKALGVRERIRSSPAEIQRTDQVAAKLAKGELDALRTPDYLARPAISLVRYAHTFRTALDIEVEELSLGLRDEDRVARFQAATDQLLAIRPLDPELDELHFASAHYLANLLRLYDADAEVSSILFTARHLKASKVVRAQRKRDHLESLENRLLGELKNAVTHLQESSPNIYQELELANYDTYLAKENDSASEPPP